MPFNSYTCSLRNLLSKKCLISLVIERIKMKSIRNILIFAFFVLCLFLLKPRQDIVFTAIDISQYIKLFEEDNDFLLCMDENNTFTGTYTISADTVFLLYREYMEYAALNRNTRRPEYNKSLPTKLYIDESASNIKSIDGQSFSAEIYIDMRHRPYSGTSSSTRELNSQKTRVLAAGQQR